MTVPVEKYALSIDDLPDEMMLNIFKRLDLESLVTCENVSMRWRKLAQDPFIWRHRVVCYSGKPDSKPYSTKHLAIIDSHHQYIKCIKLQYVYSYTIIMAILRKCENLVSLELVMCRVGKNFEEDLVRWPNLKKLNLKNTLLLQSGDEILVQYDHFENLNYLVLSDFGLHIGNRSSLISLKHLAHIVIDKIKILSIEYNITLISSKYEILETFHIHGGVAVNDNILFLLSQCPKLNDLAIVRCENLTDHGLTHLMEAKRLLRLQLWNNANFTEKGLTKTLGCPNLVKLRSLSLSKIINVTPVTVDVIAAFYKDIKFLALYLCPKIIGTDYEKQLKIKFRNIDVVLY